MCIKSNYCTHFSITQFLLSCYCHSQISISILLIVHSTIITPGHNVVFKGWEHFRYKQQELAQQYYHCETNVYWSKRKLVLISQKPRVMADTIVKQNKYMFTFLESLNCLWRIFRVLIATVTSTVEMEYPYTDNKMYHTGLIGPQRFSNSM